MKTLLGIPKRTWGIILPLIIITLILGIIRLQPTPPLVTSFEECAQLDDSLMRDTTPATCITRSGQEFTAPLQNPTPFPTPLPPLPSISPTPFPLNPQTAWQQISLPQESLILEAPPNWTIELYSTPTDPLVLMSTRSGELVYGFALSRADQNLPQDFDPTDITSTFSYRGWTGSKAQITQNNSPVLMVSTTNTLGNTSYQASWLQTGLNQDSLVRYLRPILASLAPAPSTSPSATLNQ